MPRIDSAKLLYTTPKQLRLIASQLERLAKAARVGDEVPVVWEYDATGGQVERIGFILDQTAWHNEVRDVQG